MKRNVRLVHLLRENYAVRHSIVRRSLNDCKRSREQGLVRRWVSVMGVFVLLAGCHSRKQSGDSSLLERISRVGHSKVQAPKPGELAERGRAEIRTECEKQSYENASKGLIVSEIGLHEDVFTLRDRVSYGAIGYGLDEALRLEALLEGEAKAQAHSPEQAECIQKFAEHLESVSDPLLEADQRMKELDVSAFNDAARKAEEQADKKLRGIEEPIVPELLPAKSLPR